MTSNTLQALVTRTIVETIVYTHKPDVVEIRKRQSQGFKFDKGRWYRSDPQTVIVPADQVDRVLAA